MDNETKLAFTSFPFDPTQESRVLEIMKLNATQLHLEMDYKFGLPTGDSTDHVIKLNFVNAK